MGTGCMYPAGHSRCRGGGGLNVFWSPQLCSHRIRGVTVHGGASSSNRMLCRYFYSERHINCPVIEQRDESWLQYNTIRCSRCANKLAKRSGKAHYKSSRVEYTFSSGRHIQGDNWYIMNYILRVIYGLLGMGVAAGEGVTRVGM
jgi:hypothetical protein